MPPPRSSRRRYLSFVDDYRRRRLDDESAASGAVSTKDFVDVKPAATASKAKRREYLRTYLRWLLPHRWAVAVVFGLALVTAGVEMIQPLFMRFIIDKVLLNRALDTAGRIWTLQLAGGAYLAVVIASNLLGTLKDYRQRILNVRFMLVLRQALFDRLLNLPLPKLHDMKTGGILSRLTGDVDTTTGLMQMAVVSPAVSVVRLLIAIVILVTLNWRLALTALAIIPGVMIISFTVARRVRPIYRSLRKDAEQIDGRVGETFSGIRVVRAFRREIRELLDYMRGRHTVLRKELFAHRRELVLWTSWSLLIAAVNVVIVWYGGYLNVMGRATIGDIMAFQWYTFLLLNPVWNIVNSFSELQRSLAAMERVFEVLALEPDKPDRPDAIDAPAVVHEIRFERVEFEYREARPVVRDFDVEVPGGSVVALVGRSGAGKTTVTDLVARFHDPTKGRMLLNGIDIRDFRLAVLPRSAGDRPAGRVPVRRLGPRQHRVRPPRRDGGRHRGRRPPRERPRVHRQAPGRLRDVHRRARREAVGRPAAAAGDRPGHPGAAADPDPGRGDEQPRHRERATDPGVDGVAARGADDVRDRPPAVDDPARRPDPADGERRDRRARHRRELMERRGLYYDMVQRQMQADAAEREFSRR